MCSLLQSVTTSVNWLYLVLISCEAVNSVIAGRSALPGDRTQRCHMWKLLYVSVNFIGKQKKAWTKGLYPEHCPGLETCVAYWIASVGLKFLLPTRVDYSDGPPSLYTGHVHGHFLVIFAHRGFYRIPGDWIQSQLWRRLFSARPLDKDRLYHSRNNLRKGVTSD